jgi:ATP-dependent DNA helicase RecG
MEKGGSPVPTFSGSYNLDVRHKIFLKLLKRGRFLAIHLVNRQNLGVPRIFRALLEEGKEPPAFDEIGQKVDQAFKALLSFLTDKQGTYLDVDDLLLLHFFRRCHEAHWNDIREAYPYDDRRLREKLASLETHLLMLEHSGAGRGAIYRLSRRAYDMTRRLDQEAIKVRILSLLKDRPLRNADIRNFTDLGRQQVYRIMKELESDDLVYQEGHGQAALWHLKQSLRKQ